MRRVTIQTTATSSLVVKVKRHQYEDPSFTHYNDTAPQKKKSSFGVIGDGVLRYRYRLCVPDVTVLRQKIIAEAHSSCYSIHTGSTKMYRDIKEVYWWDGMKKDIVELTKSSHFLPVRTTYSAEDYAKLYIKKIVRLHGVPVSIISDRGAQFAANFGDLFRRVWGLR
ncbi:uncharacterized protein LOC132044276 [Lycium ferocissimum]|uniref:uncharacterized protein LOC132044276 n=1 Tax=Lycium ferocissimum TaxID=112874 RepID=UPI0028153565|nr:uncharacterized protein LOC132044276 [Lycium ferocissimum]